MWQALETKARFIGQVITGDNAARRAEDIGGQELSYAEVKAIASGNPAVLTLAEADAELQRLSILKRNHDDEQYLARRAKGKLPDTIDSLERRLAGLSSDLATARRHARDMLTIGDRPMPGEDAFAALGRKLEPCRKSCGKPGNTRSAAIAGWRSASCSMPAAVPMPIWKDRPSATGCCPASIAARVR